MSTTEEGVLKKKIKADLDRLGAYWYMPVPGGYGKQSIDFLCCLKGLFIGIETKKEGGKPTPRQWKCISEIIAAGGIAFYCDSFESYVKHMTAFTKETSRG